MKNYNDGNGASGGCGGGDGNLNTALMETGSTALNQDHLPLK